MSEPDYAELFPDQRRGVWMCRFTSEPRRSKAIQAFGSDTLPTAFTLDCTFAQVAAALRTIRGHADVAFVEARPPEAK